MNSSWPHTPNVRQPQQRSVWWIKRDMRLADNAALVAASQPDSATIGLFVFEPELCTASETSHFHLVAWQQALAELQGAMQQLGSNVYIGNGSMVDVLDKLYAEDPFDALHSHEETGSAVTYRRDIAVAAWCIKRGVDWTEHPQNGVVRGLLDRDRRQPVIAERLFTSSPLAAPQRLAPWQPKTLTTDMPELSALSHDFAQVAQLHKSVQRVSESAAISCMGSFLSRRGVAYSGGISSPNSAFSAGSRLSPHLAWGTISLKTLFHNSTERLESLEVGGHGSSAQWRKSLKAFQSRLHWHDHFIQRLESAPEMEHEPLNSAYALVPYADDPVLLQAWLSGRTGMPLVDACMRCLQATGFLNFRMRAMVVTTACFGLKLSWRSIQYPLAKLFLDYEPGIHFSQIQMQAGIVGINTLRVYSPHKQLLDQDPQCRFVKKWIPELREFSAEEIANYELQVLGDYPMMVADIKSNSKLIKDRVYDIRRSEDGQAASAVVLKKHGSRKTRRKPSGKMRIPESGTNASQMSFIFPEEQ